jgi:geranylgeranylglycerol-phosphate geranylgeranyltransferase
LYQPPTRSERATWFYQIGIFIQLTRPVNVLIAIFSIAMGALVAGNLTAWQNILLACLSGGLITAAANTINDYYDIDIDKINKPYRPLAAGAIPPNRAKIYSYILFAMGIAGSIFIHKAAFAIAALTSVLLFLYSYHFKRTVLLGNVVVSFVSGLAFIYGGLAVNNATITVIPAVFAFFYHLGREILKDIEDVLGDQSSNAKTFPIRYGVNPSRWLITIIFLLLIFLTFIPYSVGIFGKIYLLIVLFGVDLFLCFVITSLWRNSSKENLHRLSEWLKLDMIIGLLAILAGVQLN